MPTPATITPDDKMKRISLAILFAAIMTPASAQISGCRAIDNQNERLACYDGLFPPSKPAQAGKALKPTGYDEERNNEEARMKKLLGPICQNCGSSSKVGTPQKGGSGKKSKQGEGVSWPERSSPKTIDAPK